MTVVAAIVNIVRTIQASKQLQQEASFVAAASTEIPKSLIGHQQLELGRDTIESFVPRDGAILIGAVFKQNGLNEAAAGFKLARGPLSHLRNRVLCPKIGSDGGLHVCGHRLNRLLAHFWKRAMFVDHPAVLPTHA